MPFSSKTNSPGSANGLSASVGDRGLDIYNPSCVICSGVMLPALERAKLLFDLRQGLVFRARADIKAATLKQDIDTHVQHVLTLS